MADESNSRHVANYIANILQRKGHDTYIIDLAETNIPLWSEDLETADGDYEHSLRGRINYQLELLLQYATALAQVRDSGVIDYEQFRYGM
ncbi:NADPH-dependent FMN reductase [Serratia proteamaculans]|uniref:NADPH-dependent FMN reductase n=1 Tax=Serratia proteamaculans TaxID=28151 RepID=UPI0039647AFF